MTAVVFAFLSHDTSELLAGDEAIYSGDADLLRRGALSSWS